MEEEGEEKMLTPRELAKILKVQPTTVRSWIHKGWLAAEKVGRRVRIKASDGEAMRTKVVTK